MKALNNIKFLCEATTTFNSWLKAIDDSETYEGAKLPGNAAFGFIDCMTVYLNTMITMENNDFTGDLGEVLDGWTASVYQHMAEKAIETKQTSETVMKLLKSRDEANG